MQILLVSANFRPSVGGVERFTEILAEGLAERGHLVTVVACRTGGAPLEEERHGVRILRIPASELPRARLGVPYPLPAPRACLRTLAPLVRKADVVHVQDVLYVTSLAALVLARRNGVRSVLTQHVAFVPQRRRGLDAAQRVALATLGRAARLADVVASYNPTVAEWARVRWRLRDVRLLPVGVHVPPLAPEDRAAVRHEHGLPIDAFVALFAGRDVPKKRLDLFLASAAPEYELVAVTDRRTAGTEDARLVPFTDAGAFARLLRAADAFVLPSEAEGFPLALQEALLAGLPCVVTRGPGYERYLGPEDAVLVRPDPGEIRAALRRLATDEPHRARLAERARAVGEACFGRDAFIDAYDALYRQLSTGPLRGDATGQPRRANAISVEARGSDVRPSSRATAPKAGKSRA